MANHALVIGWNKAVPGQEKRALEGFQRSMSFWGKQLVERNIEAFEPFFLSSHGGDLNGFMLIKGEREKLQKIRWSDEFREIEFDAVQYLEGLGVNEAVCGDGVAPAMALYMKTLK